MVLKYTVLFLSLENTYSLPSRFDMYFVSMLFGTQHEEKENKLKLFKGFRGGG